MAGLCTCCDDCGDGFIGRTLHQGAEDAELREGFIKARESEK